MLSDTSARAQFEKLLKESDYFLDIINTYRAATAQIIAGILLILHEKEYAGATEILSLLQKLEKGSGNPSIDVERRRLIALIRSALQTL